MADLKSVLLSLPAQCGVYRFLDNNGEVIYVGKAKNLKKRVSQYFQSEQSKEGKTGVMVRKIASIEHTVVHTESDAFLLENNMIKEIQPRYNILLKDDKTYPWIVVKDEPFPRVFTTRKRLKDNSKYYGPYTSGTLIRLLFDLITQLFQLRTCNLSLNKETITSGKNRVCLKYHLMKCKAPCIGAQSEEEYQVQIKSVEAILSGKSREVAAWIKEMMKLAAAEMRFEEADRYKKQLSLLANYHSKSVIVHPSISNVDVFSMVRDEMVSFVNFLRVTEGSVVQSLNLELRLRIEESDEDQLLYAIREVERLCGSLAPVVVVPFLPRIGLFGVRFHVPQRGDKLRLLEMSLENAEAYRIEKAKRVEQTDPERSLNRLMSAAQRDLRMNVYPLHIECFDNSNIQGSYPVAACVVFKRGKPSKKDYRLFHIKTVKGPDDYTSMQEVMLRRYSRLISQDGPFPQLIVVDGGKGQLGVAVKVLEELGLAQKISVVALAERLEDIYFPGDNDPLFLDKNTPTLRLLMQMRDEAHRFSLTFHRNQRSKHFIESSLREIPGIGPTRESKLLRKFKSIKGIQSASVEEIAKEVGLSAALRIKQNTTCIFPR